MIDSTHHNPNPVIYIPLISPTELILWLLAMWLCVMQISWLVSKPWSIMLNFIFYAFEQCSKIAYLYYAQYYVHDYTAIMPCTVCI